jgi:hypothetical protein
MNLPGIRCREVQPRDDSMRDDRFCPFALCKTLTLTPSPLALHAPPPGHAVRLAGSTSNAVHAGVASLSYETEFLKFLPQLEKDPGDEAAVLNRHALASAHPRLPPCRSGGAETLLSRLNAGNLSDP